MQWHRMRHGPRRLRAQGFGVVLQRRRYRRPAQSIEHGLAIASQHGVMRFDAAFAGTRVRIDIAQLGSREAPNRLFD